MTISRQSLIYIARHEQSLLGALFQTVLQLSGTIGICLCSLVQEVVYRDTGDLHKALTTVCWMMAGFAWSVSVDSAIIEKAMLINT